MKTLLILINIAIVSSVLLFNSALYAQQSAQTINKVDLKTSPSIKSKSIKTLKSDTAVSIIKRKGGWYQVETKPKQQGWLKMLWLRYEVTGTGQSGFSLLTQGSTGVTVATGVRGLSEDELEKGKGDPEAIHFIDQFIISPTEAKSFAKSAGLKQKSLPYIEN